MEKDNIEVRELIEEREELENTIDKKSDQGVDTHRDRKKLDELNERIKINSFQEEKLVEVST